MDAKKILKALVFGLGIGVVAGLLFRDVTIGIALGVIWAGAVLLGKKQN